MQEQAPSSLKSKLDNFSLIISITSTLIATSAFAFPVLKETFFGKKPEINAVIFNNTNKSLINYTISNSGDAPAIITQVRINHQENKNIITEILAGEKLNQIIEPNKFYVFEAHAYDNKPLPLQAIQGTEATIGNPLKPNCELELIYQSPQGKEEIKKTKYKCLTE